MQGLISKCSLLHYKETLMISGTDTHTKTKADLEIFLLFFVINVALFCNMVS